MVKIFLKFALAAIILYWLIAEGKLDLGLIKKSIQNPGFFVLGMFLVSTQLVIGAYRLGFLLKIKSDKIKCNKLIGIQWIGQLFATVLPGAFTSDLLKIGYIKGLDNKLSKSYIVFAILLDRLIGLNSLLFLSGVSSLIFYSKLVVLSPSMEKIIFVNVILFIMSILGMALIFLKKSHQDFLMNFIPNEKLKGIAVEIWRLKEHKKTFFGTYLVSVCGHILSMLAFWIINIPFFQSPITLDYFLTLLPLGYLAVVIPISPGGIGVGHAAFSTLFNFIGQTNGASLYNVYWVMCLIISLFGMIPFVLHKSKLSGAHSSQERDR